MLATEERPERPGVLVLSEDTEEREFRGANEDRVGVGCPRALAAIRVGRGVTVLDLDKDLSSPGATGRDGERELSWSTVMPERRIPSERSQAVR